MVNFSFVLSSILTLFIPIFFFFRLFSFIGLLGCALAAGHNYLFYSEFVRYRYPVQYILKNGNFTENICLTYYDLSWSDPDNFSDPTPTKKV